MNKSQSTFFFFFLEIENCEIFWDTLHVFTRHDYKAEVNLLIEQRHDIEMTVFGGGGKLL